MAKYKGKSYIVNADTEDLVNLLRGKWNWGDDSIAIALEIKKVREGKYERFFHRNRPGRQIQAISLALKEGWPVEKIASALDIFESDLWDYLVWRQKGDEVNRLRTACKNDQERLLLEMLLEGYCFSELASLRRGDIDFEANVIRLGKRSEAERRENEELNK